MNNLAILYPVFALALWTSVALLQIPIARFRSGFRRETVANDFKYGESASLQSCNSSPHCICHK